MNENPEGTPNPLNPAPEASTPQFEEVGMTEFAEAGDAGAPVDPMVESLAGPAGDFIETPAPEMKAEAVEQAVPTGAAMPPMRPAPNRMRRMQSRAVVDPMMRPRGRAGAMHEPGAVTGSEVAQRPMMTREPEMMRESEMDPVQESRILSMVEEEPDDAPMRETIVEQETVARSVPMDDWETKNSIVEPKTGKKSKKGLVVGAVILLLVALVCGVAAAVMLLMPKGNDRVTAAINKALENGLPSIVRVNGDITVTPTEGEISKISVGLDGTFDLKTKMSKANAEVTANLNGGDSVNFEFDELQDKDGDTFIKLSGVTGLPDSLNMTTNKLEASVETTTNCTNGTNCASTGVAVSLGMLGQVLQTIDGQWIMIPNTTSGTDFTKQLDTLGLQNNPSACISGVMASLSEYGKDIAQEYRKNPFITYSTDSLKIAKKKNALYRIDFDKDKMAAFINGMSNSGFLNALNACTNQVATNGKTSASELKEIFADYPTVYVEIDDNNNFTRVYFAAEMAGDGSNVTADLALSYPAKIEVTGPEEYLDLSTLISNAMVEFMNGQANNTDNTSGTSNTSNTTEVIEITF